MQEIINVVPSEAFKFNDGLYRSVTWTKKRFLKGSPHLLFPRVKGEGDWISDKLPTSLESNHLLFQAWIPKYIFSRCLRAAHFPVSLTPESWSGHAMKPGFWWIIILPGSVMEGSKDAPLSAEEWHFPSTLSNAGEVTTTLGLAIPEYNSIFLFFFFCLGQCLLTFSCHIPAYGEAQPSLAAVALFGFSSVPGSHQLRAWVPVILPLMDFVPLMGHHLNHSLKEAFSHTGGRS